MDVILVGGLWLDASVWDDVVEALARLGHRGVAVALPGQGDQDASATLEDQLAAVVGAIDAAQGRPFVVGHSAASTLAWLAADARPDRVAGVALVGGFPLAAGARYAEFFPPPEVALEFPGWDAFEEDDVRDLDATARQAFLARAVPVPAGVANAVVTYASERRFAVPVTLVCPEFSAEAARGWVAAGDVPELARAEHVTYVDLDTGHWPMLTSPTELARVLADAAEATPTGR